MSVKTHIAKYKYSDIYSSLKALTNKYVVNFIQDNTIRNFICKCQKNQNCNCNDVSNFLQDSNNRDGDNIALNLHRSIPQHIKDILKKENTIEVLGTLINDYFTTDDNKTDLVLYRIYSKNGFKTLFVQITYYHNKN